MKTQTPRKYLSDAGIWSAGINLFLNLLAGWLIYRKITFLPLEGATSIRGDSTVMVFIIVFFSLLLAVPGIKKALREGKLLRYEKAARFPEPVRWLLGKGLPLSLLAALLSVFTIVPPALWVLARLGVEGLGLWPFLAYKSGLAALTAGLVIPLVDWLALKNLSRQE